MRRTTWSGRGWHSSPSPSSKRQSGRPAEAIVSVEKALAVINEAKVSTAPFSFETLFTLWDTGMPHGMVGLYESYAGWMKPMILEDVLEPITRDITGVY